MKTVKIDARKLEGIALNWLVASIEHPKDYPVKHPEHCAGIGETCYEFTTDWAVGGPILEREITNYEKRIGYFYCNKFVTDKNARWAFGTPIWAYGKTLLEAAMRCFVIYHLGELVDVPEVLLS